ncbi:MAG: hypothetical protein D6723_04275 [Acidobacteria bacterium]|nr:MAG: hypothetical protein D6723_04275 [Acidobacteriota bacterium]
MRRREAGIDDAPFDAVGETPLPSDDFVVNYFNYFTEIEEHFVRRRGKHLYISSLDWALIESWKDMGIPLHVVLRGIDRVFDAYEASGRAAEGKLINSILYCQQEVLNCFQEYKRARVGAGADGADPSEGTGAEAAPSSFSRERLLEFLNGRQRALDRYAASLEGNESMAALGEALERSIARLNEIIQDVASAETLDLEGMEQELSRLEEVIYEGLLQCVTAKELEAVRKEGQRQLRDFRKRMSKELYQQTLDHYIAKRLRENYRIPRLSLFYM